MGSIQPDKGTGAQRDVGFGVWVPEIVLTAVTCCFAVRRIPA